MFINITNWYGDYPVEAKSQIFLTWDNWNDYSYNTLYGVFFIDVNSVKHELGSIKVGHYHQKPHERRLSVGDALEALGADFFSVGLDENYYQQLNNLGTELRDKILRALNDIAKYPEIYDLAIKEEVTKISFLRDLSPMTITGQFRRMVTGGIRLTPYDFVYRKPLMGTFASLELSFQVVPDSTPSTNIHVLIGRNGVGKTYLINSMIDSLTLTNGQEIGAFYSADTTQDKIFANLICISFSAFDAFDHPPEKMDKSNGIQYCYIGLKDVEKTGNETPPKNPSLLRDEFTKSLTTVINASKSDRWKKMILLLESDPIFRDINTISLLNYRPDHGLKEAAAHLFDQLSSGHKIVLLTVTRLVETLQEKSLVLIDEPESHLHPPLLSSFTRALSEVLIDTNAVAIIATHSPVILQEVPKKCAYQLRRSGNEAAANRLTIETFGENVGILTQEVFGLEVTDSGFHATLKDIAKKVESYDQALELLEYNLGLEGRAILRTLFIQKEKKS